MFTVLVLRPSREFFVRELVELRRRLLGAGLSKATNKIRLANGFGLRCRRLLSQAGGFADANAVDLKVVPIDSAAPVEGYGWPSSRGELAGRDSALWGNCRGSGDRLV